MRVSAGLKGLARGLLVLAVAGAVARPRLLGARGRARRRSARSRTRRGRSRPARGCGSSTRCATPGRDGERARVALVRGRTVIALTNGRVPRLAAEDEGTGGQRRGARADRGGRVPRPRVRRVRASPAEPARRDGDACPCAPAPAPVRARRRPVPRSGTGACATRRRRRAPTLTASGLESAALTGSTLHYRAGGNGGFTVTAAADADVARVDFATLGAGWFGGGSDAAAPFTADLRVQPAVGGAASRSPPRPSTPPATPRLRRG